MMKKNDNRLTAVKRTLEPTSISETKLKKSWTASYNALKFPVLKVLRDIGDRGATVKEIKGALNLNKNESIRTQIKDYFNYGWVSRYHPPVRPGTKRKRGAPKFVYLITEKGRHELALLEQLNAAGLPLKPRQYRPPSEGRLGSG